MILESVPTGSSVVKPKGYRKVATAAHAGDVQATLEMMRDRVARAIDSPETSPRDLAALTKRLREIMGEIEKLQGCEGGAHIGVVPQDTPFSAEAI
ncbi:MAG: hypothetical protein SPI14_06415 [Arcanobacterium sp.]|nr:hypothetical protein [Arcanobacterium sp.]